MDLEKYFQRIGYEGSREANLETLRGIVFEHVCSIPFENLDVLLDRGVSLAPGDVERKLVHYGRGGYCFEQNSLLLEVLTALGFAVKPLSARVRLSAPREIMPPRTHLFLRVDLDGVPWLADVGIGGLSPTGPIRLDVMEVEQTTPHESRRIIQEGGNPYPRYFQQAWLGTHWGDVNEFTLEEMPPIDREIGNWWTSTHPQSRFRQSMMVGKAERDGTRVSILDREFTHRRGAEVLERFGLSDSEHALKVLAERFGLHLPKRTEIPLPSHP